MKPETKAIVAGFSPADAKRAVKPPIYLSSTFSFESAEDGEKFFDAIHTGGAAAETAGMVYSRINNPNLEVFEKRLIVFDGAEAAAAFSSGMAAIVTSVMALAKPGSYLAYATPLYGGTEDFFANILPNFGIPTVAVNAGDDAVRSFAEVVEREGVPFMFFLETPANPSIVMTDLAEVVDLAGSLEINGGRPLVAVDNTFLGPIFQHPIKFGADLVLYSCTKFIGGHSDLVAGASMGSSEHIGAIKRFRSVFGTMISPFNAWLATRSMETVDMRMRRSAETAAVLARELARHPEVKAVYYPELYPEGSRQREIYEKQCSGPGSLISFDLASKKEAFSFLNNLKVSTLAVSLGSTESLFEHPASMTHSGIPEDVRQQQGIGEGMIRLSVGIEHPDDLLADIQHALNCCT